MLRTARREALLTLDKEAGMTAPARCSPNCCRGSCYSIWIPKSRGELYVGCAGGGVDVSVRRHVGRDPASAAFVMREISVTGPQGWSFRLRHSSGAGQCHLLQPARLLQDARKQTDLRLASLRGGSVRNALPREAFAVVAVPACDENILDALAQVAQDHSGLNFTVKWMKASMCAWQIRALAQWCVRPIPRR